MATPLSVCQQRDPKGLYQRAASHEQFALTGVQSPYEPPIQPDITIDTSVVDVGQAIALLSSP